MEVNSIVLPPLSAVPSMTLVPNDLDHIICHFT